MHILGGIYQPKDSLYKPKHVVHLVVLLLMLHDSGRAHGEVYNKVSVLLDQHLNNEVARQLMEEYPINTKTDMILEAAQEGATSLLRKWPDMKSKLHICFNQPLPESLRQLTWKLFLDNTKGTGQLYGTFTQIHYQSGCHKVCAKGNQR